MIYSEHDRGQKEKEEGWEEAEQEEKDFHLLVWVRVRKEEEE